MQYFGGKFRVRKQISTFINGLQPEVYLEPFCGSCWVAELVKSDIRVCCDLNSDLIAMWKAVQDGWNPPDFVTEEEYRAAKLLPSPSALRAFIGFGCSYAGKFFGGYARGGINRCYAKTAKSQVINRCYAKTAKSQESQGLVDVTFAHMDYVEALDKFYYFDVAYLDPPYMNTTKFYGTPSFDTDKFWQVVREKSDLGMVLVSEYTAPEDFVAVLEMPTRTDIRSADGILLPRVEKLYVYAPK